MIKAVLFDLDGTLYDRDSSVRRLVAQQYDDVAALRQVERSRFVERFMQLDERGYVPKPKVYRELLRELGIGGVTPEELFAYWEAHYHGHCLFYPGARETLDWLLGERLALGLITNGGFPWQLHTLRALELERYFGSILISAAEGLRKPDAAIFLRATQQLGVAPEQAVFVGDHPEVDIVGAHNAGLLTIWKREPYWPAPAVADATVDSLRELPGAIRGLERSSLRRFRH